MTQFNILFIGMNVHKESIVLSLADDERSEVRRYGSIAVPCQTLRKHYAMFVLQCDVLIGIKGFCC